MTAGSVRAQQCNARREDFVLFQSLRNLYLHSEPSAGSRRTALNASHPSWTQWWTNSCFSTRTSSFRSEGIGVFCIATLQRFITNIIIFKLILNEWSRRLKRNFVKYPQCVISGGESRTCPGRRGHRHPSSERLAERSQARLWEDRMNYLAVFYFWLLYLVTYSRVCLLLR